MTNFFARYVAFDHCRVILPWFAFRHSDRPLDRMRRVAYERSDKKVGSSVFLATMCYLVSGTRQTFLSWLTYSKRAQDLAAPGRARQLLDLFYVVFRHNYAAHDYYLQKFWLINDRSRWGGYIPHREHVLVLERCAQAVPFEAFNHKLELFYNLRKSDVPTIPILAVASDGKWSADFPNPTTLTWDHDLIIKPADENCSTGLYRSRYLADREIHHAWTRDPVKAGVALRHDYEWSREDLLAAVLSQSREHSILVQKQLFNRPEWKDISPHELINFRIVTGILDGTVSVICAILRMGYDSNIYPLQVYQCSIDMATGVLGLATGRSMDWGMGPTHIETGAQVTGRRIENWEVLKNLAMKAHECFPWMAVIGWDVIDPTEGPMVMEGNVCWGADIAQMGELLGETQYAECCLQALDRISSS